jgi:hypothetical protein
VQPRLDRAHCCASDGGFTWSTPVKINKTPTTIPAVDQQAFTPTVKVAGPFDEEQASFARGYFVGDYEGLITVGNSFGPFFGQAVSRAAGNPSDVYYTTLSPAP